MNHQILHIKNKKIERDLIVIQMRDEEEEEKKVTSQEKPYITYIYIHT